MLGLIQNTITAVSIRTLKMWLHHCSHLIRKDTVSTQVKSHHLRKQDIAIYKVFTSQAHWASFAELGRHPTLILTIISKKCQESPSWGYIQ